MKNSILEILEDGAFLLVFDVLDINHILREENAVDADKGAGGSLEERVCGALDPEDGISGGVSAEKPALRDRFGSGVELEFYVRELERRGID